MDQEFHDSAIICYNNATGEVQNLAKNFFNSMDTNGDGRISRSEFLQFLGKFNNTQWIQELFQSIDQNGDGSLDFVEFLTPFYFVSNWRVKCDGLGCNTWLQGLYFTCATCFEASSSFDLCTACCRQRNFSTTAANLSSSITMPCSLY
ncbi:uncharacterized protein LOC112498188 [Citrus sinensis]|nr:uncharacterized protein LOC18032030 [Citrus x clementina]XP_052299951.1 uncharacterized protein LOC112498188 [Citrus sinensis]